MDQWTMFTGVQVSIGKTFPSMVNLEVFFKSFQMVYIPMYGQLGGIFFKVLKWYTFPNIVSFKCFFFKVLKWYPLDAFPGISHL